VGSCCYLSEDRVGYRTRDRSSQLGRGGLGLLTLNELASVYGYAKMVAGVSGNLSISACKTN
jgi:hypothetical protein